MSGGRGRDKAGFDKIKFCAEQAAKDDLEHFWVDSCCIDKSNKAELQEAISSMFRWYQRSAKCYVYLSDVSDQKTHHMWEQAFRKSRWFTRGWTLQELLAPVSVELFSKEAHRLGDNLSLEQQIHEITGIPRKALRGQPLPQFSVNERMSWIGDRKTTLEEDQAYSLLGIFGVDIPLCYDEGSKKAFERLEREIGKLEECLRDLRLTDPRHHKRHIEHIKGGLLEASYRWILDNDDFQTWRNDGQSRLLWIRGDPGKGKTMLLCGIINELNKSMPKTALLSYFFCEATNSRINNATAVLRGLIYMLVCQQPSLISHIRKEYDHAGKALFEDSDAWFALSEVFTDMLQDHTLNSTYLIIDALDECVEVDMPKLLKFIAEKSSLSSRVKWLISSRNWPPIEEQLKKAGSKVTLCLELSAESVSTAVSIYIQHKVRQLVQDRNYDDMTRDSILDYMFLNADSTFLWVALVCQNLENTHTPQGLIRARLNSFPPGLDSLYRRMIAQIYESKDSELCKRILALIATAYEPVNLTEVASLVEMLEESFDDVKSLQEIVGLCGSFLVVRDRTIYFVHQSAKDYLLAEASIKIFPSGMKKIHYEIFSRSLNILSRKLRRNIYNLDSLSYPIERVQPPHPDPLAALRYPCLYWVDHLYESEPHNHAEMKVSLQDRGPVYVFVKEKYFYWLEAVSMCKGMPKGVLAIAKLEKLIQVSSHPKIM
jgi:archaellum biogenesis ATPase FlaH